MADMPPLAQAALALLAFVIGGGTIGPWIVKRFQLGSRAELEMALEQRFATLAAHERLAEDLNHVSGKVDGVRRIAEIATENAEAALARAERVEERQADQWERITERLADTARVLDNVTKRVEAVALEQARTEGMLRNRRHGDAQ